ncbi:MULTISPECIES: LCP family protein [Pseudonocardia]|uniref:Cell envelope-related transcriptional attenuator domain-containing protein n=1 Tax=Pseudonocardia saturnea TaxID=33909 RepID=A0ABQ0S3M4_9PSEU|nr:MULTISPECIES: LCP family protein [Pseudonocardia]BBG00313.1 hypothetical protein Pdca_15220 [Pseudonocardia autotrophica]GEC27496.1 hypothetical protein PSA01_45250 [Pseudonocardia saturnea]
MAEPPREDPRGQDPSRSGPPRDPRRPGRRDDRPHLRPDARHERPAPPDGGDPRDPGAPPGRQQSPDQQPGPAGGRYSGPPHVGRPGPPTPPPTRGGQHQRPDGGPTGPSGPGPSGGGVPGSGPSGRAPGGPAGPGPGGRGPTGGSERPPTGPHGRPPAGTGPEQRPAGPPPGGDGRPGPAGPAARGGAPAEQDGPWLRRREREAAAAAERAAAWRERNARPEPPPGRSGHSDSRPTDIRSIRATRRGIGETVAATAVPGRPDTAAERRRYRAAEPDAPPAERDRAARLSGELPVVPRRRTRDADARPEPPTGDGGPGPAGRPGSPAPPRDRPAPPVAPGSPSAVAAGSPSAGPPGAPPAARPDGTPARGRPDGAPVRPGAPTTRRPGPPTHPDADPGADRPGRRPPARPPRGPAAPADATDGPAGPAAAGAGAAAGAAAIGAAAAASRNRGPARPGTETHGGSSPGGDSARSGDSPRPGERSGTEARRRPLDTARETLGAALGLTAASAVVPGSGHLALRRRRTGGLILGTLVAIVVSLALLVLLARRSTLLQNLLSTTTLTVIAGLLVLGGIGWIAQVARTYALARPRGMAPGQKALGTATAALMCLTVAVPFGYGVELLNSQRGLLNSLFQGGGTSAAEALGKPRLNVLLLGSDAGDDRAGTRTDTMMLASIDTRSGRTTLFSLPRNIQRAEFPPGSPAAEEFPNGFNDPSGSAGDYLLNGVYAYGEQHPQIAPQGPTRFPGINLLQSTVSYMTGLPIDYYLEVNMAGFSAMIDAVGGVTVNVGPEPVPVGGVTAFGRYTTPDRYIQSGVQTLNGEDALWFARSRRDGTDYQRMGRQRCLIQAVISETSATELIGRFQSIAAVTRDNVATDMPQQVLPALAVLADEGFRLESVAFDPSLPDPNSSTGFFVTADPDIDYMREVVRDAIADPPPAPDPALAAPTTEPSPTTESPATSSERTAEPDAEEEEPASAAPQSVEDACAAVGAADVPAGQADIPG